MTCVAMNYPDYGLAAKDVRSDREHNQEFVRYVGFADCHDADESLRKFFLVRSRQRALAISKAREEQYAD